MDGRATGLVINTWQLDEAVERQQEQRRVEDGQEAHEGQRPAEGCRVSREARIAQAKDDEVGTCIDTCFKFVVPSSDPVPGHAARGQSTQDLGDGTCTTQYLGGKRYKT